MTHGSSTSVDDRVEPPVEDVVSEPDRTPKAQYCLACRLKIDFFSNEFTASPVTDRQRKRRKRKRDQHRKGGRDPPIFYAEHMTINAIAVHLGLQHEAVKRVLSPDKFRNKRYKKSKPDIFERYIADTVEQYSRIKAPRLTELLRDRGYEGSVSNARRYLQAYRARHYKAYLRLEYFPGEQAQVDWADFGKVKVEGGYRRISCFVMVLAHSRAVFARFGYDKTLESFLWGHIEAFSYFKGVARSVLYDNLKSAVIERLDGHIKFNRHLMELAVHYRFSPKACQPYSGN